MNLKSFAVLGALCTLVAAQDDAKNRLVINDKVYHDQCGPTEKVANPRLCFKSRLDINKEAIQGKGTYDGYSTSDGQGE